MYMYQIDQHFEIVAANKQAAFQALKDWEKSEVTTCPSYAQLGVFPLGDAETLEEALYELDWLVENDPNGSITEMNFQGEKEHEEDAWLKELAPYVTGGSYLTMQDGGGSVWRWYFDGKTCEQYAGELIFPGCPTEGDSHG